MWNIVLNINSALCAGACVFVIYAAGASIYWLNPRPVELGATLVFILLCTEVAFAILEES